jgi:hypothetical protein
MADRYYYKESMRRFRIYDRYNTTCPVKGLEYMYGTSHICIMDCAYERVAKNICSEMNRGIPYDPSRSYWEVLK